MSRSRLSLSPPRRRLLGIPLVVMVAVAVAGLVRAAPGGSAPNGVAPSGSALAQSSAPPAPARSAPAPALPPIQKVRVAGPVPSAGTGSFGYAQGRGGVLGTGGSLRRFHVAVERGADEDPAVFAALVEETLGDRRSWVGYGRVRLQRVGPAERADFKVLLATRATAGRLCSAGGVDIRLGAKPYTSCRAGGRVIINLDRWRLSAAPYVKAGVALREYRHYVVNHEVGHQLGHGHEGCPKAGGPAPVMVQQTLTLRGCAPYAWPRRGGRPFRGPAL